MKRENVIRRPYGVRDFEFIRQGPDGTVWQARDGMTVRVAAAERSGRRGRDAEASHTSRAGQAMVSGRARAG